MKATVPNKRESPPWSRIYPRQEAAPLVLATIPSRSSHIIWLKMATPKKAIAQGGESLLMDGLFMKMNTVPSMLTKLPMKVSRFGDTHYLVNGK